jgi:hypothetical protein
LICSTASDVLEFALLHLSGGGTRAGSQLLSPAAVRAMQEIQVEVPSGGHGVFSRYWGLGWAIYDWNGRTVLGHDGGTIGQSAFLRILPDAGVAVALLTNGGNAIALFDDLCRDVLAEAADVEMPPPPQPPEPEPDFDRSRYTGSYEREGSRVEVIDRDGQLVGIQSITGPAAAMTPEPFETTLRAFDLATDLFLTSHPAAPDMWLTVRFLTLSDGSSCMHVGGRATPKVR